MLPSGADPGTDPGRGAGVGSTSVGPIALSCPPEGHPSLPASAPSSPSPSPSGILRATSGPWQRPPHPRVLLPVSIPPAGPRSTRPRPTAAATSAEELADWPRTPLRRASQRGSDRSAQLPDRAALVPALVRDRRAAGPPRRSATSAPSSASPTSQAAVLRRPRHPRRRPPQVRLPDLGVPIIGSACSTRPATSSSRSTPTGGSRRPTRPRPGWDAAGPAPRAGRHPVRHRAHPGGRTLYAHIWKAQVGCPAVPPRPGMSPRTTMRPAMSPRRSTAVAATAGSSRRCPRRRWGPGAAGLVPADRGAQSDVYHTNEGPRRLPRRRADQRAWSGTRAHLRRGPRGGPGLDGVHHPTRRSRPASTASGADKIHLYFGGDCAVPGVPLDRLLALGAEDHEGGQPGIFNMAVMGLRPRPAGQRRLPAARPGQPGDVRRPVAGLRQHRDPDRPDHQRVHAPTWVDPLRLPPSSAARRLGPSTTPHPGAGPDHALGRTCGPPSASCGPARRRRPQAGPQVVDPARCQHPPSSAGWRTSSTRTC